MSRSRTRQLGASNPNPSRYTHLDWGLRARHGGLSIRDRSGDARPHQFCQSYLRTHQGLFDTSRMRTGMNKVSTDAGPNRKQARSTFQLVEGNALFERELTDLLNQNPRWRRGRIRDVVAARHMAHEINQILHKGLAERRVPFERLAPDIEGMRRACDSMPSLDVTVTLKTEYHRDPNHSWTPNDVCDVQALASTLPYCDVVVTDKAVASAIARTGLADRLNTVVLRTLDDVVTYL